MPCYRDGFRAEKPGQFSRIINAWDEQAKLDGSENQSKQKWLLYWPAVCLKQILLFCKSHEGFCQNNCIQQCYIGVQCLQWWSSSIRHRFCWHKYPSSIILYCSIIYTVFLSLKWRDVLLIDRPVCGKKDWLDGLIQSVGAKGSLSRWRSVTRGVIQRSILGKTLFNIIVSLIPRWDESQNCYLMPWQK